VLLELTDQILDQQLGRRCPCRDAECLDALQPTEIERFGAVDQIARRSRRFGDLAQAV